MNTGQRTASDPGWQTYPEPGDSKKQLLDTVLEVYHDLYRSHFKGALLVNDTLPLQIRAYRKTEKWSIFLLLTPWMMSRIFITEIDPGIEPPADWAAGERDFVVLGPIHTFSILGEDQKAHLNYHPRLGHYLIQPLVQSMEGYPDADSVFTAWKEVIDRRDRFIREQRRECAWQQEVSRREFFTTTVKKTTE